MYAENEREERSRRRRRHPQPSHRRVRVNQAAAVVSVSCRHHQRRQRLLALASLSLQHGDYRELECERGSAIACLPALGLPAECNVNVGGKKSCRRRKRDRPSARPPGDIVCIGASSSSPSSFRRSPFGSDFEVARDATDCLSVCPSSPSFSLYRPRAKRSKLNSFVILVCADFHEAGPQNRRGVRRRQRQGRLDSLGRTV